MRQNLKAFSCTNFSIALIIIFFITLFPADSKCQTWKNITPTDVYYLAKSVDESLVSMYGLRTSFNKKQISNNLRPRNVYLKVLAVANEFNSIHTNAINNSKLNQAYNIEISNAKPADVYNILDQIREYLIAQNTFTLTIEEQSPKTPNDVFQMLRQISFHHNEIAEQKNINKNWGTPAHVYEAVVQNILPASLEIAKEAGLTFKDFSFPTQAVSGIIPRYVYKLLSSVYRNIAQCYINKGGYDPVVMEDVNDCDDISPADVFDMTQIIAAELKSKSGNRALDSKIASQYARWKESKQKIVPGDVFRLIQFNYILTKKVLESK